MSRIPLPLRVPDASQFARALGKSLHSRHAEGAPPPGHQELLNLLARAAGHRNLQALRAAMPTPAATPAAAAQALPIDPASLPRPARAPDETPTALPLSANARKALGQFDPRGRLVRWPIKYSVQTLAMWVLWTLFEARRTYTEREVNAILRAANAFDDHATLRRELVNHRLLARESDCSAYWKLPAQPDDEARALLQAWRLRQRTLSGVRTERADSPRRRLAGPAPAATPSSAPSSVPASD
ncbi:DUF2087 domain-containing protein [Aquabacterium sp. OR-4]|uniref:DUF2087 domain-containing protein n=1 Tax=Aquabacterium sp. OR-4 TaxID=2978127 RepID=UPI0028C953E5|nr:DUF2087 domain-containing protein [Aquabacterium sp. OR-4]MDT7836785.1 DUF2087 domain-containing protein [Aquabacterium sp. OR-4]